MIKCRGTNRRGEPCARVPARGEDLCHYHQRGEIKEFLDWCRRTIRGAAQMDPVLVAHLFIHIANTDEFGPIFIEELEKFEQHIPLTGAVAAAGKVEQPSPQASQTETTDASDGVIFEEDEP